AGCGAAVVAAAVGGIPGIVVEGETGRLVACAARGPVEFQPADPDRYSRDLAAAINELLQDTELRTRMGRQGRQRVLDRYSWRAIAEQTLDFYRYLLEVRS